MNELLSTLEMNEELKYPDMDAAASIFRKLGVEPSSRLSTGDQDFEYTSCELSELEKYLGLYHVTNRGHASQSINSYTLIN